MSTLDGPEWYPFGKPWQQLDCCLCGKSQTTKNGVIDLAGLQACRYWPSVPKAGIHKAAEMFSGYALRASAAALECRATSQTLPFEPIAIIVPKNPVRLIIMAKAPLAGYCNTRLQGCVGARGAARLQSLLIRQRVELSEALRVATELHVAPDVRHAAFLAARRRNMIVRQQRGGDLGHRMNAARNRKPAVIVGTDCPALDTTTVLRAIEIVSTGGNVCVPAEDGGYVLLGLAEHCPQAFHCIHWGTPRVLRQTRRQLRRRGLELQVLPALADLDTAADFRRERRAGRLPAYGL